MKLNLVYGRSGTGKSTYLYNDIVQKMDNNKIFIIVPEQYNLSAEKKLFNIINKKSLIDVEVLTLSRMAYRVSQELGSGLSSISNVGKDMLIYDLISKEKPNLKFLGKSDKNIDIVNRMFTEFKKHEVSIQDLLNVQIDDEYLKLKLKDIMLLFEQYEEKLNKKFVDENDALTILAQNLEKTSMFDDSLIYIDEFLGFTKQEYNVLERLFDKVSEITVAAPSDNINEIKDKENDIFYFNKRFLNNVKDLARKRKIEISEIYLEENLRAKNEEMIKIETALSNKSGLIYNKEMENIKLFLANNPYTEIEYVAETIHNLVKNCGHSYNEIGIIAEEVESYSENAKSIFKKYEIPLFIDEKKSLNQNILIKFIMAMLDIFSQSWSFESVLNYMKLGLLEINNEDIYLFENYCRKWGIKGSKFYQKPFDYEEINDVQEKLEEVRKKVVNPLISFKNSVSSNKTVNQISKEIYNFIVKNNISEILDNKIKKYNKLELSDEYNTSYKLLFSIMDEMCLIFKDEKVSFDKYKNLLEVGLNSQELGKIPSTQDQVVFGDTNRTRSNELKIVFVVGINDGYFPKANKVEGYLNDNDRILLEESGIELAKNSLDSLFEEQFNVYRTLTTPEEKLYLSYTSSNKDGSSIRPSILIKKLKRIFPNLVETSDVVQKNYMITNSVATFEDAINVYKLYLEGNQIDEEWKEIIRYFYKKENLKFKKAVSGIYYTNVSQDISKENIEKLYGKNMKTSVSRLENYRKCPFSYHLTYGLKLKEKENLKLDMLDTGTFMHEVIDLFFKKIDDTNISVKDIEDEKIKEIVNEIVRNILNSSKYYIFSSSSKFRLLTRRLKKVVYEAICYIVYSLKNSDFRIFGHEVEFGPNSEFNTIKLDIDGSQVEIVGKIDRIDTAKLNDEQYVRIIDYKSSIKNIELDQVVAGLQIQLLTYLDAICEQTSLKPSGVLYMGLIDNVIKNAKNLSEEEIENKIKANFKMRGLILGDVNVVKLMDNKLQTGSSDIIPVYINKENEISEKKSSTVSKEKFDALQNKVKDIIKEISKEILKGKIDIKPYYYKKKTGCDYCKYKTICMFNTSIKNNEYNYIPKQKEF